MMKKSDARSAAWTEFLFGRQCQVEYENGEFTLHMYMYVRRYACMYKNTLYVHFENKGEHFKQEKKYSDIMI